MALAIIGVVSSTNLAAQAISGDLVGTITDKQRLWGAERDHNRHQYRHEPQDHSDD